MGGFAPHHESFLQNQISGHHLDGFNLCQGADGHWVRVLDFHQLVGTPGVHKGNYQGEVKASLFQCLLLVFPVLEEDEDHFNDEGVEHPQGCQERPVRVDFRCNKELFSFV